MLDAPNLRIQGRARAGVLIGLGAAYFLAARLGLSLGIAEQVTAVWPPSGIALAALFLLGRSFWPGVWIGALVANLWASEPLGTALGIATGNTLEGLAGAWVLQSLAFTPSLGRMRDVLAIVLAAAVTTTVAATVGVSSLCLGGVQQWDHFADLWKVWWLGDAMGVLLLAPTLLVWSRAPRRPLTRQRVVELVLVMIGLAWSTHSVFRVSFALDPETPPFAYVVFPLVIWSALRFGQHGTTVALLTTAAVATWATGQGLGPFGYSSIDQRWIYLQGFIAVLAGTGLLLGAAIAERDRLERHRAAEHAVTRVLAEGGSVVDTRTRILQVLCSELQFDVSAFWMASEDGVLRCVEFWHASGPSVSAFAEETRSRAFTPGVGLPGRVWSAAAPAWVEDVVRDSNFPRAPVAARVGLHGAMAFPVVLGEHVLGVIECLSRETRRTDAQLMQLVTSIGSHIGQFLERKASETERARLLTAEHAARRNAEQLTEDLREEQSAKDRFLAMLGHELRNPLAPITHAVQLLRMRGAPDPGTNELHAIMERQLRHMTRLVDDLLDLSRIGKGTIAIRREPVDLREVVERATETQRASIAARELQLSLALPEAPLPIHGDPTRLDQVVSNLLHNATRYTPTGGRISVVLERSGAEAVLRVRDTGIGVRAEQLDRIFDVFTQADRVPGSVNEGLGIGLALVRQIVTLHGGSAHAVSEGPGRGSEFVVRLPLSADAAAVPDAHEPRSPAATGALREKRVMIVDDNRDLAETLATILRVSGHRVSIAHDGPSALEQLADVRPEIVFLDIEMPGGMDGYEVARHMRAATDGNSPAIVALTGYGSRDDRRRIQDAGFKAHLVKPVEPATLLALIDELAPTA